MSFSFNLVITSCHGINSNQKSPLSFATHKEAAEWGKGVFEPPQCVEKWSVAEDSRKVNVAMVEGKLSGV